MILNSYLNSLLIFKWFDVIEIFFFSSLIYYCSLWLRSDKQKNLLLTFFFILTIFVVSFFANLVTITNFFISFWPVLLVIFFFVHQNTLQKNFIAMKRISTKNIHNNMTWIDDFVRLAVQIMSSNKQIICILEGNFGLNEYLNMPFKIGSTVNSDLINFLINSSSYDSNKMIWITNNGIIQSINVDWNLSNDILWASDQNISQWQKNAVTLTSKIDTVIFRTRPSNRTFDLFYQGKLIEDLTSNNLLNVLNQFVKSQQLKNLKKDWNNNDNKKNFFDQSVA